MKVVQQQEVDRAGLRKANPATSGHTAVVYLNKRGEYELGAGRMTMGELWLRTPREMYTVDVTPHERTFSLALPSREEAFSFSASVRSTWQVADPVAAVRAQLEDPGRSVELFLEERLREHTRGFGVEESAAAERQINLDYGDRVLNLSDAVVIKSCRVVLALDEGTKAHIADRTIGLREHEKHELERERARRQQELEQEKVEHELMLKRKRMNVYAKALREDDQNVLALMLAGHGEDANAVIELMMKQKQLEFGAAKEMLDRLLDANLVNRRDVGKIMANAGNAIVSGIQGGRKELPAEAERADEEDREEP
ncbi:hypothetical protein [Saccharothrix xinjiangensis]|uniref:SPFH domain/Band 7 family protein n=1 Tax=Saccharothrix xinjiangensis TaxID=204798 RepID=A0ABV9Y058_9PSEU